MLSPKTLIATRHEALRLKTGKVFIQQAWTRSTYFIHAGAHKSLFASLAVSTQSKTLHVTTRLLYSFCMCWGIFRDRITHICIYTHSQNKAKDDAKKDERSVVFLYNYFMLFFLIKMPVGLVWFWFFLPYFYFVKIRNWKQQCSQAEPSQALCRHIFWKFWTTKHLQKASMATRDLHLKWRQQTLQHTVVEEKQVVITTYAEVPFRNILSPSLKQTHRCQEKITRWCT